VSIVNYYAYVMHFVHLLYFVWDEKEDDDIEKLLMKKLDPSNLSDIKDKMELKVSKVSSRFSSSPDKN
jgi:hypothetical protein